MKSQRGGRRHLKALQPAWRHSTSAAAASERRHAPRCVAHLETRLLFSLSLQEAEGSAASGQTTTFPRALEGYTRNISETGLALVVPKLETDGHYFNAVGCRLRIMLELPTVKVSINATPVRCERLEGAESEEGYLIGVRITEMSDSEWVRLVQYVRTLR